MVSNREKRKPYKRHFSQIDDFDRNVITAGVVSSERQNVVVNCGPADHDFTVINNVSESVTNEKLVEGNFSGIRALMAVKFSHRSRY